MKPQANPTIARRNIRFTLKNAAHETSLIRMRFYVNGERMSYSLPSAYKIETRYWDTDQGLAITDPKQAPLLKGNAHLQNFLLNVNREINRTADALLEVFESLRVRNIRPTATLVRVELERSLKGTEPVEEVMPEFKDFFKFLDFYIEECRSGRIVNCKGGRLTEGSIRNYLSTISALKRYAAARREKLTFERINVPFYNDFVAFLNDSTHSRGQYKPNVIGKFIKNIKVFARYAYENDYTLNDDFKRREFKVFQEKTHSIYLTEQELAAIHALELPKNRAQVRDCFLISCYTALRYSDISRLEPKHIDNKNNCINITTQKTGEVLVIPIHPMVRSILERYDGCPPKMLCNQATNRMLKQICRQAGITSPINIMEMRGGKQVEVTYEKCNLVSSHTGRRSFATNAFKRNMPTLSIMALTGHRTESSFMRYIRLSKEENATLLQNHEFFN